MNTKAYKAAGVGAGVLLVGAVFLSVRHSNRDKRASLFLKVLRELIDGGSIGELKESAFNPRYLAVLKTKVKGVIPVIPKSRAIALAKTIYGSWHWYNDDEDAIYGVFDKLKSKVMVSQVADSYLSEHGAGLLTHLSDKLSEAEFNKIKQQVNNLKDY
jgi:hypothetical protein